MKASLHYSFLRPLCYQPLLIFPFRKLLSGILVFKGWNWALAFIRFFLVIMPSFGYIHPDEFFQCPEPMASDICNFTAVRTWEWSSNFPIRNVVFPKIICGAPFALICPLGSWLNLQISPTLLLIAPRLLMLIIVHLLEEVVLSCTEEITHILKLKPRRTLVLREDGQVVPVNLSFRHDLTTPKDYDDIVIFLLRSSHVIVVFMTRTFSTSMEMLCLAIVFSEILSKYSKNPQSGFLGNIFIGHFVALGLFLRPTFLVYIFYPLLHVCIMAFLILPSKDAFYDLLRFAGAAATGFVFGTFCCIVSDYFYFAHSSNMPATSAVTPWNFIRYNTNSDNLNLHGLHRRGLHFAVNMHLMLGPMYWLLIYILIRLFMDGINSIRVPAERAILYEDWKDAIVFNSFLWISAFLPVLILSIIPHQEPRFITSVIFPAVLLCGVFLKNNTLSAWFWPFWLIFNALGIVWYGFLHQAGVVPSVLHMSKVVHERASEEQMNLVFWRTYMIPQHLLALPQGQHAVTVHDLGGLAENEFQKIVSDLVVTGLKDKKKVCTTVVTNFT